jgi:hypothetical protein
MNNQVDEMSSKMKVLDAVETKVGGISKNITVVVEKVNSVHSFTDQYQINLSTGKRATFKSMLQAWQTYTKDNNTAQIPKSEVKLNTWARDMRKAYRDYKNNKKSTMTKQ